MRSSPFTRPTLFAAVEMLDRHTQASFDQMVLRLELENDVPPGAGLSLGKKCGLVGRAVVQRLAHVIQTVEGSMTFGEAVVRRRYRCSIWASRYRSRRRSFAALRAMAMSSRSTSGARTRLCDPRSPTRSICLPPMMKFISSSHCTSSRYPRVISTRRSRHTPGETGQPAMRNCGPSSKAFSTSSRARSRLPGPQRCRHRRTGERCLPS